MTNQQLDKLFQEKLENHSIQPSVDSWLAIENKLASKRRHTWLKIAASVALILSVGTGTYFYISTEKQPVQLTSVGIPQEVPSYLNIQPKNDIKVITPTNQSINIHKIDQKKSETKTTTQQERPDPEKAKTDKKANIMATPLPRPLEPKSIGHIGTTYAKEPSTPIGQLALNQPAKNEGKVSRSQENNKKVDNTYFTEVKIIYKRGANSQMADDTWKKNPKETTIDAIQDIAVNVKENGNQAFDKLRNLKNELFAMNLGDIIQKEKE